MASNLVIVAIPATDSDVWKVSSEKKPHLTILFLGDAMGNPNVTKIGDHVERMSRFLEPFSLLVDHRGTFGGEQADVLMFTKDIPWQLFDFRAHLLNKQEIAMAYNAIPQHTDWTPHVTLGYPDTPANPDQWDPMGQQYVTFDKVGVWYGDFEGREFTLTDNSRTDEEEAAAWAAGEMDVLKHYGVKGMRWGVRRKNVGTPEEKVVSEDAAKAAGASAKAKKLGKQSLSNDEMQALVTRMNLEQQMSRLTPATRTQKGAKVVGGLLANAGKQQAQLIVNDQVNKQIKKALSGK